MHGLINTLKAEDVRIRKSADGATLTAVIHAGNFNGYWLSKTDVHYRIELRGRGIDIQIKATNTGSKKSPWDWGGIRSCAS